MSEDRVKYARELAEWQFEIDPSQLIVYFMNPEAEGEPINLLLVSGDATCEGVCPFLFAPAENFPFWSAIAEVHPSENEELKLGKLSLPTGWSFQNAVSFSRGEF